MDTINLEARITVLEKEIQWAKSGLEAIRGDLQELKDGQNRLADHFLDQSFDLHRELSELRSHSEERFSNQQTQIDGRFMEVRGEFSSMNQAISQQTRWFLIGILGSVTLFSIGGPIIMKLLEYYL